MGLKWGGIDGGVQKREGVSNKALTLPWKHVYASMIHLVDPIRD